MYDVFISYRRGKGSDLASAIESHLERRGFDVYLDVDNRYAGDFMDYVGKAIKESSLFLLLITEGSLERMIDPNDISRREIETAIDCGIEILPISTIGDKIFKILNDFPGLPDSIRKLRNYNCRMYKHELREDTFGYILGVVENLRKRRFEIITQNALTALTKKDDEVLNGYIADVKDKQMEFQGRVLKYTGKVKFGKPTGEGTLVDLSQGLVFVGEWDPYGTFKGKCQVFRNSELIYDGEINELNFDGEGRLIENNHVYEGEFRDGKLRGKGLMISPNGTVYSGNWLGGELYSDAYIRYVNGDEYKGGTNGLQPHGYGLLICRNGKKYDGYFRNGVFEEGAYYNGNTVFIGSCNEWKPHGRGIMYNKSFKKIFEGNYKNGVPQGEGKLYTKGFIFADAFLPKDIYNKLKEFYSDLDEIELILHTSFDNDKIVNYSDFTLSKADDYQIICSGRIKRPDLGTYVMKIFKDYKEVFSNEIY